MRDLQKENYHKHKKEGMIVCIPKGDKPNEFVKNWRPISLLNVVYKIGSSSIASRIKMVLPSLVNTDQSGFIPGRYMGDNIRLIYDLIHYLNYKDLPGLLLCIDFEKAFDSVNWEFMIKVLKAFGFGRDICAWIRTFFTGIKSTIVVNGLSTQWLSIERGCRQGDPISPYLFILCVEVLGIMIRENKQIKGISINNEEHKISQFADDTQMTSEGDAFSFEETIKTVNAFGAKSGLFMNSSKTQAIWLGCKKHSEVRFLPHLKMDWNPPKFKILGVWFTADLIGCEQINYDNKFTEIKMLFKSWIKRLITPLGRIAVLKSLILSKIVQLWMLLPNPPDNFIDGLQKMCYLFVWNRKKDKISRKTVVMQICKGGLGLPDIRQFINALKLSWLRRFPKTIHKWKNIIKALFPSIEHLDTYGPNLPLNRNVINGFWADTITAYTLFTEKVPLSTTEEILAEPLLFNNNLKIGSKPIIHKEWCQHGVKCISDVLHNDGTFLTFIEFNEKYALHVNFIVFYACINAVKKYLRKFDTVLSNNTALTMRKSLNLLYSVQKGTKLYYNILMDSSTTPNCCAKWDAKLSKNIDWLQTFQLIQKIKEVKLKWFQIRLVHRILGTNAALKKMRISDSELCTFCNTDVESLQHLFWDCVFVRSFWLDLENIINDRCHIIHDIHFNEDLVLFGNDTRFKSDDVFDLILLLAKFYIYQCKMEKSTPQTRIFLKKLMYRFEIEKFVALINLDTNELLLRWMPYMPLIN